MRISVNELSNDMIIDEDIYNSEGGLILSRGLLVSDEDNLRKLLKRNNIKKVKVLILGENTDLKKESKHMDYNDIKSHEIETFLEDFSHIVDSFEQEVINTLTGKSNLKNIEFLLEDTINSNLNKNTNIFQLLQKIKDSDDITFIHCNSVSLMSYTIGKWLKLSQEDLKDLSLAGLFFDVGKYKLPKDILTKTQPLTYNEFEIVKGHVNESIEILRSYNLSEKVINAVKFHHERCDGSGYPYGLKGDQIPTMAKIIGLSDIFIALTSKRPYRPKYTPFEAIRILESDYAQKLDIVILSEFIKRIVSNYIGSEVELSNGMTGEILFINATAPLRPIIKLSENDDLLDLSSKANSDIQIKDFI